MRPAAAPGRLLVASFLALVVCGTLLLKLPLSTPPEQPIGWIDALFTATSASCVTGLTVRDTGGGFTPFGQGVILGLVQAGGLGIMTFSMLILSLFRSRVPFHHRAIYETTLATTAGDDLAALVRLVFVFTFVTEALGAVLLLVRFAPDLGLAHGTWAAVFHAVSAFCNAGFGLWPDSLIRYRADPWVNLVVAGLVMLGGIGFFVVFDLIEQRGRWRRLALHSKLALVVTAVLVAGGAVAFWALEAPHLLDGLPFGEQVLISLFQSVTTRTAGFNTVDVGALAPPTLFVMAILMFIGGSPGSAAGGIKTTTFGILFLAMRTRLRGHRHVDAFHRTLSRDTVGNALAIALAGAIVVVAGLFALLLAELPTGATTADDTTFFALFFETVSALATVGLSTGVTPTLEPASRLVVAVLMFLGRLGPLTVASTLAVGAPATDWRYPEEDVGVG